MTNFLFRGLAAALPCAAWSGRGLLCPRCPLCSTFTALVLLVLLLFFQPHSPLRVFFPTAHQLTVPHGLRQLIWPPLDDIFLSSPSHPSTGLLAPEDVDDPGRSPRRKRFFWGHSDKSLAGLAMAYGWTPLTDDLLDPVCRKSFLSFFFSEKKKGVSPIHHLTVIVKNLL